jgi:hypothetical protein
MPIIILVVVGFCIWTYIQYRSKTAKLVEEHRANTMSGGSPSYPAAAKEIIDKIRTEYPFSMIGDGGAMLCMDQNGKNLRLLDFNFKDGTFSIRNDLITPITKIVSVELSDGRNVVTDYVTDSKKTGALGRAVVGELLFGGVGAIVGATSAGSKGTMVAKQRAINGPSELVFVFADFTNPLARFRSKDYRQCEVWLHRVRAAIAQEIARSN